MKQQNKINLRCLDPYKSLSEVSVMHVPAFGVGSLGGVGSVGVVLLVLGLKSFT